MVLSIIQAAAEAAFGGTDVQGQVDARKAQARVEARKRAYVEAVVKAAENGGLSAVDDQGKQKRGYFSSAAKAPASDKPKPSQPQAAPEPKKQPEAAPAPTAAAAPSTAAASDVKGNATQGASLFKAKCATCHTCNDGGPNKQGPNLYGIMGQSMGGRPGFKYTKAVQDAGKTWTTENMLSFLTSPKAFVKGTSMAFPGFKKEQDRADVVAYLNSLK